ncbi:MAG: hypothetical protein AB7G75_26715 [Candidatus Binatia bacterium]
MVGKVTRDNALPPEVVQQIVAKTDGVPLFVEELTKSVVEAVGAHGHAPLQLLDIPATLQDSLMARLDRLNTAKELAQLGATIGREFSYELLHAVSLADEETLPHGLKQLVEVELLYQRGLPPQATYFFKHALIQDTAYQSLLKSKRQQYHHQIAQVLEQQFSDTKENQPELLAHHYTEAGLTEQAIPYWQQAGERAAQRSANVEAITHLTTALELVKTLSDTPERTQQELLLQITLGGPLMATQGYAAVEVEKVYSRALELCRQVGEVPQLFPVLRGLWNFYGVRGNLQAAYELGEQVLSVAQSVQDPVLLMDAYWSTGLISFYFGQFAAARVPLEQGIALYDSQRHRFQAFLYGHDPGIFCLSYAAWTLWVLGYPDQALKRSHEALDRARELSHPHSQAIVLNHVAWLHHLRREEHSAKEQAEAAVTLSTEHGFAQRVAMGNMLRGWAIAEQGQEEEGIAQIRQGLTAYRATGAELIRPYFLALLAEAYGKAGKAEQGLAALVEAFAQVEQTGECWYKAELHWLKGELTRQSSVQSLESRVTEAEECFWKAREIAQKQHAKSLELRVATSLARLWQQQAAVPESRITDHASRTALAEAYRMLSAVYHWFTEGFDTKDLQEAKALLRNLGEMAKRGNEETDKG